MALVERTTTIHQSYQDWRLHRNLAEIYEISRGKVIGMGPVFLEVFGAITRRLDDLHQRNSFCGNLLDTLNIRTEFQPLNPPRINQKASPITTVWFPAQPQQCTEEEILRSGILSDLESVRYMVEDILHLYPLPAPQRFVVHQWTHLLNQTIYRPNRDMTLEQARRVALYNYSSPLFLGNTQLHHLIKRIYELIQENKVYFFNAVPLDESTPEADMSDWKDRLPWDHRYAPNDRDRQPRFCAIMYHPESQVLQKDYRFGRGVSLYLREAFEHERDPDAPREDRKWSETLSRELFEMLPDALPNIHYLMCNNLDVDEHCRFIFGRTVVEVLRHGPCGYNGGT